MAGQPLASDEIVYKPTVCLSMAEMVNIHRILFRDLAKLDESPAYAPLLQYQNLPTEQLGAVLSNHYLVKVPSSFSKDIAGVTTAVVVTSGAAAGDSKAVTGKGNAVGDAESKEKP